MKKSLSFLAGAVMSFVVVTGYADTVNEGGWNIISSGQVSVSDLRLMLQRAHCKKNTGELTATQASMLKESSPDDYSKLQKNAQSHLMKSYKWCRAYFSSLSEFNKRKLDDANKQLLEKVIKAWGSFKYMGLSREETLVILSASKELISQFSNPPQELQTKVSDLIQKQFNIEKSKRWPRCKARYDLLSMNHYMYKNRDNVKKFINEIDSNADKQKKLSDIVDRMEEAYTYSKTSGLHTLDLSLVNPAYAYRAYKKLGALLEEHQIDWEITYDEGGTADHNAQGIRDFLLLKLDMGEQGWACDGNWKASKIEQLYLPVAGYLRTVHMDYFQQLLKQYVWSSYSEILNQSAEFKLEDYEKEREHGEEVMYDSSDHKWVLIREIARIGVDIGRLYQQAIDARVGMGFGRLGDEDNPQYRWTMTNKEVWALSLYGGIDTWDPQDYGG